MAIAHLHLLHPPDHRLPGIVEWLGQVEQLLHGDPAWDGWALHRLEYDDQARFHVDNAFGRIRAECGPVIVLQNVQYHLFQRLKERLQRHASVYLVRAVCAEDVWAACEAAKTAFDAGEPLLPIREIIAYLILKKLERQGMWGGGAKNKDFLWGHDLPKGGFPKDEVGSRDVMDVADELVRVGVLQTKKSTGKRKFALGGKEVVSRILEERGFGAVVQLRKFFDASRRLASIRLLDYND